MGEESQEKATMQDQLATPLAHCIVIKEEAYNYIAEHKLNVNFRKELKDGTPRRIWELRDPEGTVCGTLFTAFGLRGQVNRDNYTEDIFDFMELNVSRDDFADPSKSSAPHTPFFINLEIEENGE